MLDAFRLFTGKKDLSEIGLPWLHASEEFNDPARHKDYAARRNTTGRVALSIYNARALTAALEGHVLAAVDSGGGNVLTVKSRSDPGRSHACWWQVLNKYWIPNAESDATGKVTKITYHLPLLWIARALYTPLGTPAAAGADDFLDAYEVLLEAYAKVGWAPPIEQALVRAADELYYSGRYGSLAVGKANDGFPTLAADNSELPTVSVPTGDPVDATAFSELDAFRRLRHLAPVSPAAAKVKASKAKARPAPAPARAGGFVGWQVKVIEEAITAGLNALLAGPTGTGKTMAVEEAVATANYALVGVEGKEGLLDLDFLGAIVPKPDGARLWTDGPLLRAMRLAQTEPVAFFIDELNRIPRPYQNVLIGAMNAKTAERCQREGVAAAGDGPFYVVEVPMTSEVVWCPVSNLRFLAAGNFGQDYSVFPLDPAIRRRFDVIVEFEYLERAAELRLVLERTGLGAEAAEALCLVAEHSREMRKLASLPGCIDTASLLTWARLCTARKCASLADALQVGKLVWADVVCGRDHQGAVNLGKLLGLADWLKEQQPKLPPGDFDRLAAWTF